MNTAITCGLWSYYCCCCSAVSITSHPHPCPRARRPVHVVRA